MRLYWQEWFCCLDHANFVVGRSFVVVCGDYVAITVMVVSFFVGVGGFFVVDFLVLMVIEVGEVMLL